MGTSETNSHRQPVDRHDPARGSPLRLTTGRNAGDVVDLVVAAAVTAGCSLLALSSTVSPLERALFQQVQQLPGWSGPLWRAVIWAGSAFGIAGAVGLALYTKRVRLGLELIAGGTLAWVMTWVVHGVVGPRPVPVIFLNDAAIRHTGAAGFPFPSSDLAVAAALAAVANPFLGRVARRLTLPLVVLVGVSELYLGRNLALGIVGGVALGVGIGSIMHLIWGAPRRRTTSEGVFRVMARAGLEPSKVVPAPSPLLGPVEFEVTTEHGDRLLAEVVQRLHRRAGAWYKLRRVVASLEVESEPGLSSPRHEADHQAYVTLLAERANVRTPSVVLATEMGHGPALIVRREVRGRRLTDLVPGEVDDALLDGIWCQVVALGRARIAHHDLRAKNVLVDEAGLVWILDFAFSRAGAPSERLAQDRAEMLVSLAGVVGIDRAVDSALRSIPQRDMMEALPYVHPLALPGRIRRQAGRDPYALTNLRALLAERLECLPPSFRSPVRLATVLSLALLGGAVYLLLPQVGTLPEFLRTIRHAHSGWVVLAVAAWGFTYLMAGAGYLGASSTPLPLWRTIEVQLAASFTSRTTPGGVGGMGLNLIYLERLWKQRANAIGVIALNQAAGLVVHSLAFVVAVAGLGAGSAIGRVPVPRGWPVLVAVAGVLIGIGIVLGTPLGRRKIVRPSLVVGKDLLRTLSSPKRALLLFGGSAGVTLSYAVALAASVAAFDPRFSWPTVIAVYVVGSGLASAAPTPGNLGAIEAALVAGLTSAGIQANVAVAGVLTFRLITFWFPILPGLAMVRYLQHRGIV